MFDALALLNKLSDEDTQWLFDAGKEQQVISGTVIIREGTRPEALFFVLEGMVGVTVSTAGDKQLGTIGTGEFVGEISLLEDSPATATITAVENSLLLAVPFDKLSAKLDDDPWFAQRVYRAFASIASRRLRERVQTLTQERDALTHATEESLSRWTTLNDAIVRMKADLQAADQQALKASGEISEERQRRIVSGFREFCELLNREIGGNSGIDEHVVKELGGRVKMELLPYLLLTQTAERFYSKPRGYAGDFLTIEMIYRDDPAGTGRLGPLLDRCFLNEPAAKAVRNRRGLLTESIRSLSKPRQGDLTRITSLACGPAAEVFDLFGSGGPTSPLLATLVDIDSQALEYVRDKAAEYGVQEQVKVHNGNLVYLATGRQRLDIPAQDMVYSIGLIDYFNDKFVIKLSNYIHRLLKPGGRVILGNFHPANTTRALMDHILAWQLIHRTEDDMHRLFCKSDFGRRCTDIRFEGEGVNLFAECVKAGP